MGKLSFEHLGPERFPDWDAYVAAHPQGTVFQTARWLRMVSGNVSVRAVLDGDGTIRGGVGLTTSRKMGVRGYHVPPYTPYFGPLVSASGKAGRAAARSEEQKIIDLLLEDLGHELHCDLRLPPGAYDFFPYVRSGFTVSLGFTHELQGAVDDYRANIGRRQVTYLNALLRSVEEGSVEVTTDGDPEEVLELWRGTASRKGFGHREALLRRALAPESGLAWTAVVVREKGGLAGAGALVLNDERRAYNLVNGSVRQAPPLLQHANLLCLDVAIRETLEQGRVFDFEGSLLPGVERFYRLLGGVQVPIYRLQRSRSLWYGGLRAARQVMGEMRGARA